MLCVTHEGGANGRGTAGRELALSFSGVKSRGKFPAVPCLSAEAGGELIWDVVSRRDTVFACFGRRARATAE